MNANPHMNWTGKSEPRFPNDKIEEYELRKKLDGGWEFVKKDDTDEWWRVKVTDHSIQMTYEPKGSEMLPDGKIKSAD